MKNIRSERLKKLEQELQDLEQWLKLGLVPKKDIEKHKEEIRTVKTKIDEEKERIQFLKESGETEEFIAPKRSSGRTGYTEMPTIPDIDLGESAMGADTAFETEHEATETETTVFEEETEEAETTATQATEAAASTEEAEENAEEEDFPFSDRNRWRRGGILDPDADEW